MTFSGYHSVLCIFLFWMVVRETDVVFFVPIARLIIDEVVLVHPTCIMYCVIFYEMRMEALVCFDGR